MIKEDLENRSLPDVLTFTSGKKVDNAGLWQERRNEIIKLLGSEIYGFSPMPPANIGCEVIKTNEKAFAGKAVHSLLSLSFETPKGTFSFPVNLIILKKTAPVPAFLNIAFRPDIPDIYLPVEEIIDGGYAIVSFCYKDIVPDADDGFSEGLAAMYEASERKSDEWGKISMWAWAASRVMDCLQTVKEINMKRVAVVGHSRLGKTALWCAAQDERFSMAISNDSGCSGAALSRGKTGERVARITQRFGYWFCKNYAKYADNEENMPFDQHFLLAAAAPRHVYVSSASEDDWADPKSELLSCVAASPVYELLGLKGLVAPDEYPEPGTAYHEGYIGYHLREGTHYLSRYDWQRFMEYRDLWNV